MKGGGCLNHLGDIKWVEYLPCFLDLILVAFLIFVFFVGGNWVVYIGFLVGDFGDVDESFGDGKSWKIASAFELGVDAEKGYI